MQYREVLKDFISYKLTIDKQVEISEDLVLFADRLRREAESNAEAKCHFYEQKCQNLE